DGPYRRLMGPQLAEPSREIVAPLPLADMPIGDGDAVEETGVVVHDISKDAAAVGWPATIATLLGFIRPWRRQLAVTVTCGIGRVIAFIGVSVLGALIIGAVRMNAPAVLLTTLIIASAPLAGLLHW